ncbi:MAG TPA: DsbA family oxidoreductase [Polyangiaceae bacterium]|nr:DsbA family oxidoreductase [Polyangiaceae bacterium]
MSLKVHVWSDVACPWCYIGKRRLEAAVEKFGDQVEVEWHSFELDPKRGPRPRVGHAEMLAKKYGVPEARAQSMIDNVTRVAAQDGLDFQLEKSVPASTFDAHRLIQLARARGKQPELEERLFRAYFTEGVDVASASELTRLGADAGLDVDEIAAVLASDDFSDEVQQDKDAARELGITGVPFFVIGRYGVSGAQPAEQLLQVLDRANAEQLVEPEFAEGAACGPDGC